MTGSRTTTQAEAISVIEHFIGFNTESLRSNLDLIAWAEDFVRPHGATVTRTPNAEGDKATLCITVGPNVDGGVILSGHTDVVPVAGQAWSSDPYRLRQAGGKLFGRGTSDMKSFCAIAVACVPAFAAAGLRRPVHIVLSYDEEITSRGSIDAIEAFGRSMPRPAAAIVGEPTMMGVADTHKSISTYWTTVNGHEAHSSKPTLGANAIQGACDLIHELYRLQGEMEKDVEPTGRIQPGYSTINVGTVHGGTARNILARECRFLWEFRGLPGVPQDFALDHLNRFAESVVLPKLKRFTEDAGIATEIGTEVPGLAQQPGSAAETLALKLARANKTVAMPFATEAGQFQIRGIPTVLCGPGNVDQAHQPDEFIAVDQVDACLGFMERLKGELAA